MPTDVPVPVPDPRLTDLLFGVCTQAEKEQCLREVLEAAIEMFQTGDSDQLRNVLLSWEDTCLWKRDPDALRLAKERENAVAERAISGGGRDWREILKSLGVEG